VGISVSEEHVASIFRLKTTTDIFTAVRTSSHSGKIVVFHVSNPEPFDSEAALTTNRTTFGARVVMKQVKKCTHSVTIPAHSLCYCSVDFYFVNGNF
jgi:hypothetical protein